MNLAKFATLRARKGKKTFFFLHSIRSKITVVKEKAGKKRKSEKEKRRGTEYLYG